MSGNASISYSLEIDRASRLTYSSSSVVKLCYVEGAHQIILSSRPGYYPFVYQIAPSLIHLCSFVVISLSLRAYTKSAFLFGRH